MEEFTRFIGSWHPLLVHLPIGMLIMAFLLERLAKRKAYAGLRPAVPVTLLAGAITSIMACIAGYFLSLDGGYNAQSLALHKWMGIAVAVLSLVAWGCYHYAHRIPRASSFQFPLLLLLMLLLGVAGHYGGSLTHGSDYLTDALPSPVRGMFGLPPTGEDALPLISNVQEAAVFDEVVQPIFRQRCLSCHNADKMKGDLRLDGKEMILKGGESGPVLKAGKANESELYTRLLLPEDHDDHMPPKGKTPLSDDQIRLLHWWIENGAPFEGKVSEISQPDSIVPLLTALEQGAIEKTHAYLPEGEAPEAADPTLLNPLRERGILIMPVANESPWLQLSCINDSAFSDKETELLLPLAGHIVWLDLSNTAINDEGLKNIAQLKALTRLELAHTAISDRGLAHLAPCKNLGFLNLFDTGITDQGLKELQQLTALKEVHLYQSQVSAAGITQLKQSLEGLRVDTGNYRLPLLAADTVSY